jgi:hypothetical protein
MPFPAGFALKKFGGRKGSDLVFFEKINGYVEVGDSIKVIPLICRYLMVKPPFDQGGSA